MNLQELATDIEHEAQQQALAIEQEAREEVARIKLETQRLVSERTRQLQEVAQRKAQAEAARLVAKQQRDAHMALLQAKQELLEQTFAAAAKELAQLKGTQRTKLLEKLLRTAQKQIAIHAVLATNKDKTWLAKKTKVTGTVEGSGGFIARNKEDTVRVDMRFERLLEDVKAHQSNDIARALFG